MCLYTHSCVMHLLSILSLKWFNSWAKLIFFLRMWAIHVWFYVNSSTLSFLLYNSLDQKRQWLFRIMFGHYHLHRRWFYVQHNLIKIFTLAALFVMLFIFCTFTTHKSVSVESFVESQWKMCMESNLNI